MSRTYLTADVLAFLNSEDGHLFMLAFIRMLVSPKDFPKLLLHEDWSADTEKTSIDFAQMLCDEKGMESLMDPVGHVFHEAMNLPNGLYLTTDTVEVPPDFFKNLKTSFVYFFNTPGCAFECRLRQNELRSWVRTMLPIVWKHEKNYMFKRYESVVQQITTGTDDADTLLLQPYIFKEKMKTVHDWIKRVENGDVFGNYMVLPKHYFPNHNNNKLI